MAKARARRSLDSSSPRPKRRLLMAENRDAGSHKVSRSPGKTVEAGTVDMFGMTTAKPRRRRALRPATDSDDHLTPARHTESGVSMTSDLDEDLPSFDKVNSSFTDGDLIWVKFRKFPFWPALVSQCFYRDEPDDKIHDDCDTQNL